MKPGSVQSAYLLGKVAEKLDFENLYPYIIELDSDRAWLNELESAVALVPEFRKKKFGSAFELGLYRIASYALIRALKPKRLIETGVLHGLTTQLILEATHKNKAGSLLSIDLPSFAETGPSNKDGYTDVLPQGKSPGWAVSERLKGRWRLELDSSRNVLPRLSNEIGTIDYFCHDSEHTYETMTFELKWAWPRLTEGGIIVCDNVDSNSAFQDFCRDVGRAPVLLPSPNAEDSTESIRFGIVRK